MLIDRFLQTLLLGFVFTSLLTILVSPVVVALFRRQVTLSMNRAARGATTPSTVSDSPTNSGGVPRSEAITLIELDARSQKLGNGDVDNHATFANAQLNRVVTGYVIATAVHAVVTTVFFFLSYGTEYLSGAIFLSALSVFCLPVIVTVTYLRATRLRVRLGLIALTVIVALIFAGEKRALMITVTQLHIVLPAFVFLIFNLRYWRSVAPMMVFIAAGISIGWLIGFQIGRPLSAPGSVEIWAFRLSGAVAGGWLGWRLLRWLSERYRSKTLSDEELFIDVWWALFTLFQTVLFVVQRGPWIVMYLPLAFTAYWTLRRHFLRDASRHVGDQKPIHLLLLRVFGHDRRTERLLDEISQRWRFLGTIQMIAGRDLAARTIDPHELFTFIGGGLSREFIKDPEDLRKRVAAMDLRPDPDGRYRINEFFCHQDTWQSVLNELVAHSDTVLMDLRGFDEKRLGCRYELEQLARYVGEKPVVFLADRSTKRILVAEILQARAAQASTNASAVVRASFMLNTARTSGSEVKPLLLLLLGAKPRPAP